MPYRQANARHVRAADHNWPAYTGNNNNASAYLPAPRSPYSTHSGNSRDVGQNLCVCRKPAGAFVAHHDRRPSLARQYAALIIRQNQRRALRCRKWTPVQLSNRNRHKSRFGNRVNRLPVRTDQHFPGQILRHLQAHPDQQVFRIGNLHLTHIRSRRRILCRCNIECRINRFPIRRKNTAALILLHVEVDVGRNRIRSIRQILLPEHGQRFRLKQIQASHESAAICRHREYARNIIHRSRTQHRSRGNLVNKCCARISVRNIHSDNEAPIVRCRKKTPVRLDQLPCSCGSRRSRCRRHKCQRRQAARIGNRRIIEQQCVLRIVHPGADRRDQHPAVSTHCDSLGPRRQTDPVHYRQLVQVDHVDGCRVVASHIKRFAVTAQRSRERQ